MNSKHSFAHLFRAVQRVLKVTTEEMTGASDMSVAAVNAIEHGRRAPSTQEASLIARFLGRRSTTTGNYQATPFATTPSEMRVPVKSRFRLSVGVIARRSVSVNPLISYRNCSYSETLL